MNIRILGSGGCTPEPGRDAPCLLINGSYLVDTGWNAAAGMRGYGRAPSALKAIFLTHLHMDHYLGLPGVLFSMGLKARREAPPLELDVVGPTDGLADLVDNATAFLQWDLYTHLRLDLTVCPLEPKAAWEDGVLHVQTFALRHSATVGSQPQPTESLGYVFTEKATGASFATAWDTSYCPAIVPHIEGQDILFHDAGHSSAAEAATIAKQAGVERLFLVHYGKVEGEKLLRDAREVFPGTFLAEEGESIHLREHGSGPGTG